MTAQIPLVDYLVLGDEPAPRRQRVHRVRRPVLRPPQRVRLRASAPTFTQRRRAPPRASVRAFTIVPFAAPGRPGAVRGRGRRLRRHQRARQRRSTSSPTPSTCTLGMKVRLATYSIGTDDDGTEAIGFGFEPADCRRGAASMSDDIWILGITMTKFGKHPDKDIVDLAAEAAMGALADGGVTMEDMGILAAGNLMRPAPASASSCRSRSARPASPSTTWPTPAPPAPPRCAPSIMAVKAGEADMGLAVGVEKLAGAGLLSGGSPQGRRQHVGAPRAATAPWPRSTAASAPRPCPACSPRSAWSTATSYGGTSFELFARISREEPRPLHAQPAGRLHQGA